MGVQKAAGRAAKPLKGIKALGKPRPIGETAYASLREAIVRGDLHPGQRLVENTLSGQMKVSRIPVREAMRKLEQDGLVERLEKGGFVVKDLSAEEIEETFGIRAVLESYAAGLAAARMDRATVARLGAALAAYKEAMRRGDTAKMIQCNDNLDEIIFTASGSRRLRALIGNFRDFISRYRKRLLTCPENAVVSLAEHEKIVEAMEEGNVEKVETLVRKHLLRGMRIVLKDLSASGGS